MPITNRQTLIQNAAKGLGVLLPVTLPAGGSGTTATAGSGHVQGEFLLGTGTTYNSTLVGLDLPPALSNELFSTFTSMSLSLQMGGWLVRYYLLGTLNLTATGDQFTHDAATFPVLRKKYGEASKPVTLMPVVYLTTALTTTAATCVLKTDAGGAGYVDQDGNATVGTKTFTFPSTTTAVNSTYLMMPNSDDFGIQDITQIDVDIAAATGAANIYGMELLAPIAGMLHKGSLNDMAFSGLQLVDLAPAVATSGTVTSYLGIFGAQGGGRPGYLVLGGVLNA